MDGEGNTMEDGEGYRLRVRSRGPARLAPQSSMQLKGITRSTRRRTR